MDDFLVKKLNSLKRVEPNSSWLDSQRSFLLSLMPGGEKEKSQPSLVLPLFHFNILKLLKPNFAIALTMIILISSLATVGVISASQNSLPGDFLYPVKTAFERTQLTLTTSEEGKTKLSIKFATYRMDEFTQLVDNPEKKDNIEKTVENFTNQLVTAKENIDKLKEKNSEKAAEVAKMVKTQTSLYEETLTKNDEQLAYIIPALEANKALKKASEDIVGDEEPLDALEEFLEQENLEEILVPAENVEEVIESESFDNNIEEENIPQEEQTQEE